MPEERKNKNSAARIAANNRYNGKVYDRINIAIPKCRKAAVEAAAVEAAAKGLISKPSVNGLLNMLLRQYLGFSEAEWKPSPEESAPAPVEAVQDAEAPEELEAVQTDLPEMEAVPDADSEAVDVEAPAEDVSDVEAPVSDVVAYQRSFVASLAVEGKAFDLVTLYLNKGKRETLKLIAEEKGISISELVIKAYRSFRVKIGWPDEYIKAFAYTEDVRLAGENAVEAAAVQDAANSMYSFEAVTVWIPYIPLGIEKHNGRDIEEIQHTIITALEDYIDDYDLEYSFF